MEWRTNQARHFFLAGVGDLHAKPGFVLEQIGNGQRRGCLISNDDSAHKRQRRAAAIPLEAIGLDRKVDRYFLGRRIAETN